MPINIVSIKLLSKKNLHAQNFSYPSLKTFSDRLLGRKQYQRQLPAITHVDGSARVQTVLREDNPRFWALLSAFGKVAGLPILLNTSFNVRGQPIVRTPEEAVDTFLSARLHALAIGKYVVVPVSDAFPKSPQKNHT
jgi:predicted NodU family carbamoyl transferase